MKRTSTIELSESALRNNLEFLREELGDVRFSSVIKGNAYGHGVKEFVIMAERNGVDHFSVFSADEAREAVEASNGSSQFMIMGYVTGEDLEWAVSRGVSFFVFDMFRMQDALNMALKTGERARIHLELETGFNRTGFAEQELEELAGFLKKHKEHFKVEGVCTHYAGAESVANHVRVRKQKEVFEARCDWLKRQGISIGLRHTACSAAALTYPDTRMDMVRIGILQYGFWPSRETLIQYLTREGKKREDPLKRLICWKTRVMSVKKVRQGEFVGYGTSYLAEQEMHIATIPVGYSHGYSRVLSNQGRVLIGEHRLGVIGMVNMNVMMVDITESPDVRKGDEVILIGADNNREISVASFGELSKQLNYELLARLPHNIPRIIVD